jgi:hypothetical protein
MGKAKYVLTAHNHQGPLEKALGQKDSRVAVYDDADLKRRQDAAKTAGVKTSVKKLR